jgi:translation initiation factor 2B subunit (eIF-2B alpha/beta/delta family)
MDSSTAAQILARELHDDRLIVLVGSGASASCREEKREYRGLPTPKQFVELAAARYSYIHRDMSFLEACDAILARERRAGLEDALLRTYQVPASFHPPPAHRILSWLPFSAYLTSNYDQFIERSLERELRQHHLIIDNTDVVRLKRGQTPIIKYHGCVSRPSSMVAASKDYEALQTTRALVRQLIGVSLANRVLLVIGHGLGDWDLSSLLNDLLAQLRDYAPLIFVIREPGRLEPLPEFSFTYEPIAEDLNQFLNRVLHEYRQQAGANRSHFLDEAWLTSAFFAKLRHSFVLPSETQVIDAFLEHLADELGARNEVETVLANAGAAVDTALQERPNYAALRRTWAMLTEDLVEAGADVAKAEGVVRTLIANRESKKAQFASFGRTLIKPGDRLLLYSQSQRVLQVLTGVPRVTQSRCEIFVAECRPKSPSAYQDAIAICRSLSETDYSLTICPDVVAINLIATGQITRILMGTHAVYVDEGTNEPYAFVNTCGSLAVSLAAERYKVPIVVIGETIKVEAVGREAAVDHLFVHQENDLLEGQLGVTELSSRRDMVAHTNIGYDLVNVTSLTTVVIPDDVAR